MEYKYQLLVIYFSDEHSERVKSFMLDVLTPLIIESDTLSTELLNIILMNIVEPNKSQRKNAFQLASELIVKTSQTLEPYIQNVSPNQSIYLLKPKNVLLYHYSFSTTF